MSTHGEPGGHDDRTRRVDDDADDATRPVGDADEPRPPPRRYAYEQTSQTGWSAPPPGGRTAAYDGPAGTPGAGAAATRRDEPPRRAGRDVLMGVIGALLGFIVAVLVVALTTGGDAGTADPAATGEVATLQARVAELEAQLAQAQAELDETEAQLDQARAAAGDSDQLQQQREALEQREAALDQRQAELDRREAALNDREAALEAREDGQPAGDGQAGPDGDGPAQDAENVVEDVLQRLRDLLGGQ